jgi:hypothetical protein
MRMLAIIKLCPETFAIHAKAGTVGAKVKRILDELKPEAAYFTETGGRRTAILIFDLPEASKIPTFAEPWFLQFNASFELHPIMSFDDLAHAHLDTLAKKWA